MSNSQELPEYQCKRCLHQWTPRIPNPTVCPRCKSAYWDKDKRVKQNKEEGRNEGA